MIKKKKIVMLARHVISAGGCKWKWALLESFKLKFYNYGGNIYIL